MCHIDKNVRRWFLFLFFIFYDLGWFKLSVDVWGVFLMIYCVELLKPLEC
jgi:hypothetical protein